MPRHIRQDTTEQGHDSFLDVVANIVGILIILVMVVGVRAKNAPVTAAVPDEAAREAAAEMENLLAAEEARKKDVRAVADQIRAVRRETQIRYLERGTLANLAAARRKQIELDRGRLDADAQKDFDLGRGLSEARLHLDRLRQQQAQAQTAKNEPIVIESYPTPLSETVDGREVHFQLRAGLLAFVPLDRLLEQFKSDARRKAYRLRDLPEITEIVGPLGGFRLRYTLERYDVPAQTQIETGRGGSFARLRQFTLIPVSNRLGQPVEDALAEGSEFRRVISGLDPGRATITIWTYPDSFAEFRRLKKELYALGFPTAARLLPEGVPIAGSPDGTRSAAQ